MSKKTRTQINEIKSFVPRPGQLAKARELLGWSITTACEKAKVTPQDLVTLESDPRGGAGVLALELAYRQAGVQFAMFAGPSGCVYKTKIEGGPWFILTLRGPFALRRFHNG